MVRLQKFIRNSEIGASHTRVYQAETPELPIARSNVGPGFLADSIVKRWQDHFSRVDLEPRARDRTGRAWSVGKMNNRTMKFTVVVEEDPPGNWHAYAPAVPGCFAGGRSRAEAVRRYRAALKLHLEELTAHGEKLPTERHSPAVQVIIAA